MMRGEVNLDIDAALVPLQSDQQAANLILPPSVVEGQVRSIAGLFGPDILFATAANSITVSPVGSTVTFGLSSTVSTSIFNATSEFRVAGTKVVGARDTGWTATTGTANKGAYATYAGQTVSGVYAAAEVQAIDDALKAATQRIKALEDALRAHGLIN